MASDEEGMSTGKKVVAGAAVGVAIPAAIGAAKKLIGSGDDEEERPSDESKSGRQQSRPRGTTGSPGPRPRTPSRSTAKTGSTKRRSAAKSGSTAKKRSTSTKKRSTSKSGSASKSRTASTSGSASKSRPASRSRSASKSRSSKSGSSSSTRSGSNRTREQLYRQATRLKIEGRSSMTKAELERAVNRAKSRRSRA
jgi:hypothetical protein